MQVTVVNQRCCRRGSGNSSRRELGGGVLACWVNKCGELGKVAGAPSTLGRPCEGGNDPGALSRPTVTNVPSTGTATGAST